MLSTTPLQRGKLLALAALLVPATAGAQENGKFLGLELDGSFSTLERGGYVAPISNPLFNETPYITTEVRGIYFHHELPDEFVTGGGNVDVGAIQARVALTERLGFIATKDGYADFDFDDVLEDEDGFLNIAFGLKYAFFMDPASDTIVSAGLRYEVPINDLDASGIKLGGDGDGFVNPFVTGATSVGDLGLQASFGGNFALDDDEDTSFLHYSMHADYEVLPGFFPLVELNGYTATKNGERLDGALGQLDGVDALNFGSTNRRTTMTAAGGFRYRITDRIQLGSAIEAPITGNNDTIFDYRVYADLVIAY